MEDEKLPLSATFRIGGCSGKRQLFDLRPLCRMAEKFRVSGRAQVKSLKSKVEGVRK